MKHYRIELTWLMLLLLFALMTPKKAFAGEMGRSVAEDEGCDGDPLDCVIEQAI